MKYLFAILAALLLMASAVIYASYPDLRSEVPVIYWVTDRNPAREQQVATFHRWLVEQGHVTENGDPMVELRLDTGNNDQSKKIIQGVSGVAGDIMDTGSMDLSYLSQIGILQDVTEVGEEMGFSRGETYEAAASEISVGDRQYGFPCNVTATLLWVNKSTFEKYDQPIPPQRWTLDEFEERGKAFVAAANEPGERQMVFFAADLPLNVMFRSLGLSTFNETMTRCTLDDPRFAEALARKQQWIEEDRILPSTQEREGFDTAGGYGGATLQLFNRGNYGMFPMGRYALIQLRRFGDLDMAVVEPPHGGFPNTTTSARAATVYVGGAHPELAYLFMAYLASKPYNDLVVADADALPPNPAYTQTEAFKRPADHPNEWGLHEPFSDAMEEIAIGGAYSPFVLPSVVWRELDDMEEAVMNRRLTAEEGGQALAATINSRIERNVHQDPALRERYEQLLQQQAQIDALRAAGEPVPVELIENPFYRKYYEHQGWLAETTE
ncbi:MAG: ABC transporter substrate-binding protein [Phycisphaeraceae bacterium]